VSPLKPELARWLVIDAAIAEALRNRAPVVALESTLIAHGLPRPDNLAVAARCEALLRERGAVPATIAVIDGRLRVGLDRAELERLAGHDGDVVKASTRDLPVLLAQRRSAGTTVAATMAIAALAGIEVFATGGIGGVHRGWSLHADISADLMALARPPVAVVCAGAKSILDLAATLELLETLGVPVIGYRSGAFPAFFAADSGLAAPQRADTPAELAAIWRARRALGDGGGMLVANPPPASLAMPAAEAEELIEAAVGEAAAQGIGGKALTPFLLRRVDELSGGRSRRVNVALIEANAALAAELAGALAAEPG
jgi:pseudouridine-5'-phosphate glycosidase